MEFTKARNRYIHKCGWMIIENLEAFGIKANVEEAQASKEYNDYVLALEPGTNLTELRNLTREMALAAASPTGQVFWQPIDPGGSKVILRVPNLSDDQLEARINEEKKTHTVKQILRNIFDTGCFFLSLPFLIFFGKNGHKGSLRKSCELIEKTLKASGIFVKVAEVNINERDVEYCCYLAVGTRFSRLEKLSSKLAQVLSSPTGKVSWQLPVPGTYFVGLRVPKSPGT